MSELRKAVTDIRAVVIPLHSGHLLLPNATVAEVIGYEQPTRLDGRPDWMMGTIIWRQQHVPVVSFEETIGRNRGELGHRAHIVVCNTLNGDRKMPYIGLVATGIPRLLRVQENNLEPIDSEPVGRETVLGVARLNGDEVWIPDLDSLEGMVRQIYH
jgi:chemosensory pili system protein ChpC